MNLQFVKNVIVMPFTLLALIASKASPILSGPNKNANASCRVNRHCFLRFAGLLFCCCHGRTAYPITGYNPGNTAPS